jgi:putative hydrolase of the HAD superfamily
VLLDLHGTLVDFGHRGRRWGDVMAEHGVALDEAIAVRYLSQAYDGRTHARHSRTESAYLAWEGTRIRRMLMNHGLAGPAVADLADEIHDQWRSWRMIAFPEVADSLRTLRAAGYRLIVCSNWEWRIDHALRQAGLCDLVDGAVCSARVGARKPHPRIFRAALRLAGTAPREAVFVGDSWTADVLGSVAMGLRAVHVDRCTGATGWLSPDIVRVPELSPLVALVAGAWTAAGVRPINS